MEDLVPRDTNGGNLWSTLGLLAFRGSRLSDLISAHVVSLTRSLDHSDLVELTHLDLLLLQGADLVLLLQLVDHLLSLGDLLGHLIIMDL